jgi:hypothetical protein
MQMDGLPITIDVGDGGTPLANYLSENPPVLILTNGSEVKGTRLLAHADSLPTLFAANDIAILDWHNVPIRSESKWRGGVMRPESVQGRLIDTLLATSNTFIFDDDDTGEIADVVEIIIDQQDALIRLYHCKYSGGDEPGVRVGDLYEVCGQAIKSSRSSQLSRCPVTATGASGINLGRPSHSPGTGHHRTTAKAAQAGRSLSVALRNLHRSTRAQS